MTSELSLAGRVSKPLLCIRQLTDGGAHLESGALGLPKAQSPAGIKYTLSMLIQSWEGQRETVSLEEVKAESSVRIRLNKGSRQGRLLLQRPRGHRVM